MPKNKSSLNLPGVEKIGIIVDDLDQAVDFYANVIGWGRSAK